VDPDLIHFWLLKKDLAYFRNKPKKIKTRSQLVFRIVKFLFFRNDIACNFFDPGIVGSGDSSSKHGCTTAVGVRAFSATVPVVIS